MRGAVEFEDATHGEYKLLHSGSGHAEAGSPSRLTLRRRRKIDHSSSRQTDFCDIVRCPCEVWSRAHNSNLRRNGACSLDAALS